MMTTVDCEVHHENRANEGGVIVSAPGGFTVRAKGNYDGIGSDNFEA